MNNPTIESTSGLRLRLGEDFAILREEFDPLKAERRKTALHRRHFEYTQCPSCRRDFSAERRAEVAHIRALEHGYRTLRPNLILLCRACHKDYDAGYASCSEIVKLIAGEGIGLLGDLMETRRAAMKLLGPTVRDWKHIFPNNELSGILAAQNSHRFSQAARLLARLSSDEKLSTQQRAYARLLYGQFQRRRGARGTLQAAFSAFASIDAGDLPDEMLPLFYYELAFLKMYHGEHPEAEAFFVKSGESALRIGDDRSRYERVLSEIVRMGNSVISRTVAKQRGFNDAAFRGNFDTLASEISRMPSPFDGKALLGMLTWKLPFFIKYGHWEEAQALAKDARCSWEQLHLQSGWNRLVANTLSSQAGLIDVSIGSKREIQSGIEKLTRELVTSISGRPRRPEGLRDVIFGIALGLSKLRGQGFKKMANRLVTTCRDVMDGSSFLATMEDQRLGVLIDLN